MDDDDDDDITGMGRYGVNQNSLREAEKRLKLSFVLSDDSSSSSSPSSSSSSDPGESSEESDTGGQGNSLSLQARREKALRDLERQITEETKIREKFTVASSSSSLRELDKVAQSARILAMNSKKKATAIEESSSSDEAEPEPRPIRRRYEESESGSDEEIEVLDGAESDDLESEHSELNQEAFSLTFKLETSQSFKVDPDKQLIEAFKAYKASLRPDLQTKKLIFKFGGRILKPSLSANDEDLESGDQIDVTLKDA